MSEESNTSDADYVRMNDGRAPGASGGAPPAIAGLEDRCDLRIAIVLPQQENGMAYDAQKKRHDAGAATNANRTSRSNVHNRLAQVRKNPDADDNGHDIGWFAPRISYRRGHRYGMHEIRHSIPWPTDKTRQRVFRYCDRFERTHKFRLVFFGLYLFVCLGFGIVSSSEFPGGNLYLIFALGFMFMSPILLLLILLASCDDGPLRDELQYVPINGVYKGQIITADPTSGTFLQQQQRPIPSDLAAVYHLRFSPNEDGNTWNITGEGTIGSQTPFQIIEGTLHRSGRASWQEITGNKSQHGGTMSTMLTRTGCFLLPRNYFTEQKKDEEMPMSNGGLLLELHRTLWAKRFGGRVGFGKARVGWAKCD